MKKLSYKTESIINKILDFIIYLSGYTLTLYLVDLIFNAFEVDGYVYYFLASLIIFILNKTIKPIVFRFTLPITGLTFGLFYFVIDFFMLEIVDFILGRHFDIYGIFWGIFIAFTVSVVHVLIEEIIIRPLVGRKEV